MPHLIVESGPSEIRECGHDATCGDLIRKQGFRRQREKYAQIEKEALAIVWAIERFKFYLLGGPFEVETDHRPLVSIFKPSSTPPGRIERWVLKLQDQHI